MTKRTPKKRSTGDWRPAFLAALRNSGNVRASCQAAGIGRSVAYDQKEDDPIFAKAWADAMEDACDALEAAAQARAMTSSDTLLIFLLKAHRPEKFREPTVAAALAMGVKGTDGSTAFAILQVGDGPSRMIDLINPDLSDLSEPERQAVERLQAPKEKHGPEGSGRTVQSAEEGG